MSQLKFNGQLICSDLSGQKWTLYLSQGCLVYATGGVHSVRRWRRNLVAYCRPIPTYRLAWQISLAALDETQLPLCWEYALLNLWLQRQDLHREQAINVIRSAITEVLFDLMQAKDVTAQIYQDSTIIPLLDVFDIAEMLAVAQQLWVGWQAAKLQNYSPNQSPVIRQSDKFNRQSSTQFYQRLSRWLNGQHTLRDLAVELQRDPIEIAASLRVYIEMGWIELIDIADLPAPASRRNQPEPASPIAPAQALIACVDDSPMVRQMMEELLTSAGYEFIGVADALRAIGILLARKPDLIFLDLMMPHMNGYELCEQLRKLSCFRHTPIVILTGNDGFANRLRSNIVQASDFLSKPLNAEVVLGVIHKYLNQSVSTYSATASQQDSQFNKN
ncbi:response regulator [Thermocoleostomius sinensis]|uniref:Response regulator n=1 Tax=Thermocoleostomius sinensis A174 TaxID=2016057 RepID=A0A9E8ZAK4_9CYAN|nr:response regulator [Thermocoleostomius sinensis]WAL59272.1 response regulator [Thermocoleostomius sinensis A174]